MMLGSRLGGVHFLSSLGPSFSDLLAATGAGGSISVAGLSSYDFSAASMATVWPGIVVGVGVVCARVIPLLSPFPRTWATGVTIVGVLIALAARQGRAPPSAPARVGTP